MQDAKSKNEKSHENASNLNPSDSVPTVDEKKAVSAQEVKTSSAEEHTKNDRSTSAFWKVVWPKLTEGGWEKITMPGSSDSSSTGVTVFTPIKVLDLSSTVEGKDYFVRIEDVLGRIKERRNSIESSAADRHRRAISKPEPVFEPDFTPSFTRTKKRKVQSTKEDRSQRRKPSRVDLSWKDGGKHFPKGCSRIGEQYQASDIPKCNSETISKPCIGSETFCELLWDPAVAKQKGVFFENGKDMISDVAHNIREKALYHAHRVDYDIEKYHSCIVPKLTPVDGSEWTAEQKDLFHSQIFRCRRNLQQVAKAMNLPMLDCHCYYLRKYKTTTDYRLLKAVCLEERENKAARFDHEPDSCVVCHDGGKLLICDSCEREYHMKCLRPPLKEVPEGRWECDECVDERLVRARDFLVCNTKLFERVVNQPIAGSNAPIPMGTLVSDPLNSGDDTSSARKVLYRPIPEVIDAVRKMVNGIGEILAEGKASILDEH